MIRRPPKSPLFPHTPPFRSDPPPPLPPPPLHLPPSPYLRTRHPTAEAAMAPKFQGVNFNDVDSLLSEEERAVRDTVRARSEEHTSELQSPCNLVCRLLLEKKKTSNT